VSSRWAALITAGTIATLLLAGTSLVAITKLLASFPSRAVLPSTTAACLPSDFPSYPDAERAFSFRVGPVCSESFTSGDTPDHVASFFETQLETWPWRVTGSTSSPDTIYFGRRDSTNATGEVQALATRFGSQFTISYTP